MDMTDRDVETVAKGVRLGLHRTHEAKGCDSDCDSHLAFAALGRLEARIGQLEAALGEVDRKLETFGDYREGTADPNLTLGQAVYIHDARTTARNALSPTEEGRR